MTVLRALMLLLIVLTNTACGLKSTKQTPPSAEVTVVSGGVPLTCTRPTIERIEIKDIEFVPVWGIPSIASNESRPATSGRNEPAAASDVPSIDTPQTPNPIAGVGAPPLQRPVVADDPRIWLSLDIEGYTTLVNNLEQIVKQNEQLMAVVRYYERCIEAHNQRVANPVAEAIKQPPPASSLTDRQLERSHRVRSVIASLGSMSTGPPTSLSGPLMAMATR